MQSIRLHIVRPFEDVYAGAYFFGGYIMIKNYLCGFSKGEILLWCSSSAFIILSFCLFDKENYLTLAASLVGVTSLIFNAKGNPFGQFLMIIFSLLYGIISLTFSYYCQVVLRYFLKNLKSA